MSSFMLTRTLNVRIWLSKNIHLFLKKNEFNKTFPLRNKKLITTVCDMVVPTLPHGQMFYCLKCIDF